MRKLKFLVYLLTLGVFISCFGNASFAWAATEDKKIINQVYDLNIFTAPLMVAVGTDKLEETLTDYVNYGIYAVCEDNQTSLEIIPSYDYSSVNTKKEGCYSITLTLQYDKKLYQLSDEYQDTYTIPVCISDPDKFEIFPTFTSVNHTTLSYIHAFKDYTSMKISYLKSKEALTLSKLEKAEWIQTSPSADLNSTPDGLTLSSSFFTEDGYLYIRLSNENLTSNILCLEQKNDVITSKTIEGDRDGGDYSSEDSYEIVAPVSTPKSEGSTKNESKQAQKVPAAIVFPATPTPAVQTANAPNKAKEQKKKKSAGNVIGITSSATKTSKAAKKANETTTKRETKTDAAISHASTKTAVEQVGSNHISLSGKRLRLMAESNPVSIPFTYDNYLLEIPSKLLLALNLKDDELLTVTFTKKSDKEVSLDIRAAQNSLTQIPGSHLTWKNENKTLAIDKTGTYKPPGSKKENLPVKTNKVPRILFIGLLALVLVSTGCFVYRKKERKH